MPEQPQQPQAADPAIDALELDELEDVSGGIDDNTNKCQGNIAGTCGLSG